MKTNTPAGPQIKSQMAGQNIEKMNCLDKKLER